MPRQLRSHRLPDQSQLERIFSSQYVAELAEQIDLSDADVCQLRQRIIKALSRYGEAMQCRAAFIMQGRGQKKRDARRRKKRWPIIHDGSRVTIRRGQPNRLLMTLLSELAVAFYKEGGAPPDARPGGPFPTFIEGVFKPIFGEGRTGSAAVRRYLKELKF